MAENATHPAVPVWWDITPKSGAATRGFGQTAYAAAADAGLLLSEVSELHVSEDQATTREPENAGGRVVLLIQRGSQVRGGPTT